MTPSSVCNSIPIELPLDCAGSIVDKTLCIPHDVLLNATFTASESDPGGLPQFSWNCLKAWLCKTSQAAHTKKCTLTTRVVRPHPPCSIRTFFGISILVLMTVDHLQSHSQALSFPIFEERAWEGGYIICGLHEDHSCYLGISWA